MRTVYMLDGAVIKVKSCFSLDEITIYAPPVTIPGISFETFRAINFVAVEQETSTTTRLVHFYDFNGDLIRTINLNDHLGIPERSTWEGTAYNIDKRVTLIAADGDLDSVFVHAWVNNWRNYPTDFTTEESEHFVFNRLTTVKIPIAIEKDPDTGEDLPPTLIQDLWPGFESPVDFSPIAYSMVKGGQQLYTAYWTRTWHGTLEGIFPTETTLYSFEDSGYMDEGLYTNSAIPILSTYFDAVVEDNGDYRFYSPHFVLIRKCSCIFSNLHIAAVEVRTQHSGVWDDGIDQWVYYDVVKYCIGVWPAAIIDERFSESLTSSYSTMTDLLTLTEEQYKYLAQILVHGNKFYLFYDSQTFTSIIPYMDAYELNMDTLKLDFIQRKTFSRNTLDRVSILRMTINDKMVKELGLLSKLGDALEYIDGEWQPRYVICYRLIDEWAEPEVMYSDMLIMDLETLVELKAVTLPQLPTLGFLEAIPSYAQRRVNEERLKEPGTPMYYLNSNHFPLYTMPIRKVSNDFVLQYIMGKHLQWCIENGRMSHDGIGGSMPEERASAYGYINVGEILTTIPLDTIDTNAVIDMAIQAWLDSPNHKDNMVRYTWTCMGFAFATFPADTTSITVGEGMYLGGGSYSTGDTVVETGPCRICGILFGG